MLLSLESLFQVKFVLYQVYELTAELEKMTTIQSDHIAKVGTLTRQLEEKDAKLRRLQSERHRQLEEVYEMKYVYKGR